MIYELGKTPNPKEKSVAQNWPLWSYILAVADQISCYIGFLALFWYFSWIIGLIFLITTLFAFVTVWMAEKSLHRTEKMNVVEKPT